MTRWPRLGNLALALAAVALAVALLEAAVRLAGFDYGVDHNWRYHPELGWTQVPGARYEVAAYGTPFEVAFNRSGFRDDDHEAAPGAGVRRVVVLGDSFSEAIQVPLEATWHQRLEALLEREGERWEVINLGVGDFGTAQQRLMLERALVHEPALIVHQLFPLNDVCNNNRALAGLCRSLNDGYRPYFRTHAGALEPVRRQPVRKWLRDHSLAWFLIERRLRWVLALRADDAWWERRFERAGFTALDPMLWTFVPDAADRRPVIEAGWALTEALLTDMVRRARAAGVAYLAVVVPFEARVGGNWPRFRAAHDASGAPAMDPAYPERRLAAHFSALEVPMVALRPVFEDHFEAVMPYRDGHLSPGGHERMARALLPAVRAAVSPGDGNGGWTGAPPR